MPAKKSIDIPIHTVRGQRVVLDFSSEVSLSMERVDLRSSDWYGFRLRGLHEGADAAVWQIGNRPD